ncbi:MAG: YHS domain-containing (seleno)protein [Coraliomargarita sp.]
MQPLLKNLSLTIITLFLISSVYAQEASDSTRQKNFSLSRGDLAIGGYDPVSYWSVKGPTKGDKKLSSVHKGVVYRFANKENKSMFLSNPSKFEPQYGGWCAWAMIDGDRTKPDPKSFKIVDEKLYLFYDGLFGDTRALWNQRIQHEAESKLIETADSEWAAQLND